MKLSELKPNLRNPRKISDDRLVMLKKSLDEFGDLSGTVWNRRTQRLVSGHQRGKVLPPDADIVIMQQYDPPTRTGTVAQGHVLIAGEKFAYREVDWDEQKETAGMIAANRHGGEWDYPTYADLMLELEHSNYDLDLTGNTESDLEKLFAYIPKDKELPEDPEPDVADSVDPLALPNVCRIVLFYPKEVYESVIARAQEVLTDAGLSDMSDLFDALLKARLEQIHANQSSE